MKYITIERFFACMFGIGISALIINLGAAWLVSSSPLFEGFVVACLKGGTDYYHCVEKIDEHWLFWIIKSFQILLSIYVGYFWFKLMTKNSKSISVDAVLTVFLLIFLFLIVASGDFSNYLNLGSWAFIYSIGPLFLYLKARSVSRRLNANKTRAS